jgi:hypothetical protein
MLYDDYFWTELTYERHSYVAPSGEVLIHINYDATNRTYRVEDKEFISLMAAKAFAIAYLKRTGKIPDDDDGPPDLTEEDT